MHMRIGSTHSLSSVHDVFTTQMYRIVIHPFSSIFLFSSTTHEPSCELHNRSSL